VLRWVLCSVELICDVLRCVVLRCIALGEGWPGCPAEGKRLGRRGNRIFLARGQYPPRKVYMHHGGGGGSEV